jgi:uncharacterized protein (DUF1810 family)
MAFFPKISFHTKSKYVNIIWLASIINSITYLRSELLGTMYAQCIYGLNCKNIKTYHNVDKMLYVLSIGTSGGL